MSFKNLSVPKISKLFENKNDAINAINQYINANVSLFEDGNIISFKYKDENDTVCSSLAIVNKDPVSSSIWITPQSPDNNSIIILPNGDNKDALWLSETESSTTPNDIIYELDGIRRDIDTINDFIEKYEIAFTEGFDSGNIYNSTVHTIESSVEPIKPDNADENDSEIIEIEPDVSIVTGNVKHIMIKYAETEDEIKSLYRKYLCNYELIWCKETKGLYINNNGVLVKINSISSNNESSVANVEGINSSEGAVDSIIMRGSDGTKFTVKIGNNGVLSVYDNNLDTPSSGPSNQEPSSTLFHSKLYINMVYCGGIDGANSDNADINEHSYNYCSHNFVELSNLTGYDINLNGMSLQYADKGETWKVLPLFGKIKNGGTFLIRGAQCSVMESNTTKIKVKSYDLEWIDSNTGKPIQFSNNEAKFYLTYGTTPCKGVTPYTLDSTTPILNVGYIDLVGFNNTDAFEKSAFKGLNSDRILTKYYTMDPVSQATKNASTRNNANDWTYIDLTKNDGDIIPNILDYTPKASFENKTIFFNKSKIDGDKPSIITCSLGIQATDNGEGATRCFNWISKNYYDEYLWIYTKNEAEEYELYGSYESFKGETDKSKPEYYYNRIRMEASDGTPFTAHKAIVRGLRSGTYYYGAGRSSDMLDMDTDLHKFTVLSDEEANKGFSVLQTSDQQGFNWEEYQVWKYAANKITEEEAPNFMINTGDMVQNGNRINEWIDYFNAKGNLSDIEEMATIGNNDLCPKDPFILGDGSESSKINPINITFFYTFEIDPDNPCIFNIDKKNEDGTIETTINNVYVPSLYSFNYGCAHFMCINSEITINTEATVFGINWATNSSYGFVYEKVKEWCEKDIATYGKLHDWNIAYCHEMPFTILTEDVINSTLTSDSVVRVKGSKLNDVALSGNEFWFSKFCQNNGIRLVLGGHKHTEAISYPILENTDSSIINYTMKPIIQVNDSNINLIRIEDSNSRFYGQSFPEDWFMPGSTSELKADKITMANLCSYEMVSAITAPVYAMLQSTGYKQTSNKELPGANIPWLAYYYPKDKGAANSGQKYPFYTMWEITPNNIIGKVKRVHGIMNKGKFNINVQGVNINNGEANINDGEGYKAILQKTITIDKTNVTYNG